MESSFNPIRSVALTAHSTPAISNKCDTAHTTSLFYPIATPSNGHFVTLNECMKWNSSLFFLNLLKLKGKKGGWTLTRLLIPIPPPSWVNKRANEWLLFNDLGVVEQPWLVFVLDQHAFKVDISGVSSLKQHLQSKDRHQCRPHSSTFNSCSCYLELRAWQKQIPVL